MDHKWQQWEDLPPEREEELIESISENIVKRGLGAIALMTLESGGRLTSMFADFYMGIYGPYLDFLEVDEYGALLRKKSSVKKLIERIQLKEDERSG